MATAMWYNAYCVKAEIKLVGKYSTDLTESSNGACSQLFPSVHIRRVCHAGISVFFIKLHQTNEAFIELWEMNWTLLL